MWFAGWILFALVAPATLAEKVNFGKYTCPMEGPKFDRPTDLANSKLMQEVFRNLTIWLDMGRNGTLRGGWTENATFSIAIVNQESRKPLWEYHVLGKNNPKGTKHVDGDSQYHIGSLSKLLTTLLLKKSGIDMNLPITHFVPELNNSASVIQWNEISLESLANHLGGVPTNLAFLSEYYKIKDKFEEWGFPDIPDSDYGPCSVDGLNKPCNKKQTLERAVILEPVAPPNRRPVYSQLSYIMLGYALSNYMGGKSYRDVFHELLVAPLKLNNTGVPEDRVTERGVIPPMENWWDYDHGETVPGTGIHASTNDVSAILHGLLSREFMSDSEFLHWVKPTALTSTAKSVVGTPWEIDRYDNLIPNYPQYIDVYSKSSATYGYSCKISMVEQYGVGFVWFTAGDTLTNALLPDFVMTQVIPALEEEARRQVLQNYGYLYTNTAPTLNRTNSTLFTNSSNNSVVLGVTVDTGPGLVLTNFTRGGKDIMRQLPHVYQATFGKLLGITFDLFPIIRLLPTDLRKRAKDKNGREIIKEDWRIRWDPVPDLASMNWTGSDLPGLGVASDACESWINADWMNYGGKAIEKVVFIKDAQSGKVIGAELPALRANVTIDHNRPIVPWWTNDVNTTERAMSIPAP